MFDIVLPKHAQEHLADKAIALWRGDRDGVARWLESIGCTVVTRSADEISMRGLSGVVVGVYSVDPVDACATLGMALFGLLWPMVAPDLLSIANKRWREIRRQAKAA